MRTASFSALCCAAFAMGCGGATRPAARGSSSTATSTGTGGAGGTTGALTTSGSTGHGSSGSTASATTTTSGSGTTTGNGSTATGSTSGSSGSIGTSQLILDRPYGSVAPANFDPAVKLPLVVMLHGYTSDGATESAYLGLDALVDAKRFFYAAPDGTRENGVGNRFWNATDACCNFYGSTVDDVAYLTAVVDDMAARYPIDPKRVFFVGHSNGGFMTHRMACERAGRIAAVLSLAGAQNNDAAQCTPSEPVSVVELHGDADQTIRYGGGQINGVSYPSAETTVSDWAAKDGCGATHADAGNLDLESTLPGAETNIQRFDGCSGGAVELWTIQGGSHIPSWTPSFAPAVIDWLFAHPKP